MVWVVLANNQSVINCFYSKVQWSTDTLASCDCTAVATSAFNSLQMVLQMVKYKVGTIQMTLKASIVIINSTNQVIYRISKDKNFIYEIFFLALEGGHTYYSPYTDLSFRLPLAFSSANAFERRTPEPFGGVLVHVRQPSRTERRGSNPVRTPNAGTRSRATSLT